MAKDVDLSSKEWCDIVFENKNKDFGAYTMRRKSDGRHNKSMIVVVIFIIIVSQGGASCAALLFLSKNLPKGIYINE